MPRLAFTVVALAAVVSAEVAVPIDCPGIVSHSLPAFSYADFSISVSEEQASHGNLMIEVKDESEVAMHNAVEVYLHAGTVPRDPRSTQMFVKTYTDREHRAFALAVNVLQLQPLTYHVVLLAGARDADLEISIDIVGTEVDPSHSVHGHICPGEWVYHHYRTTGSEAGPETSLEWLVEASSSALTARIKPQFGSPPLRLTPPTRSVQDGSTSQTRMSVCPEVGGDYWLAVVGEGDECGHYTVGVKLSTSGCVASGDEERSSAIQTLPLGRFEYGECTAPFQYLDYTFQLDEATHSATNLRFEAQLRAEIGSEVEDVPDAISLLVYTGGEVPQDRHTELRATQATDGIWSVMLNEVELYFLIHGAHGGDGYNGTSGSAHRRSLASSGSATAAAAAVELHVAVKCGPDPRRFQLLASVIPSRIDAALTHAEAEPCRVAARVTVGGRSRHPLDCPYRFAPARSCTFTPRTSPTSASRPSCTRATVRCWRAMSLPAPTSR